MSNENSRRAVSYLVRLWVEDRENEGVEGGVGGVTPAEGAQGGVAGARARGAGLSDSSAGPTGGGDAGGEVVRGFVRNLKTGQEHYLPTPDRLVRQLLQDLAVADRAEEESEGDARGDFASGGS